MSLSTTDIHSLVATQYLSGECANAIICDRALRAWFTVIPPLSAVAVTITLYDRLLVFRREIELIWRQPWSTLSILVLVDMYGRQASMLYIAYSASTPVRSGALTRWSRCQAFNRFIATYGLLSTASVQFALILRIYTLWDNRRVITVALIGGFILFYGITLAFAVISTVQTSAKAHYYNTYRACGLPAKPTYLIGAYAGILGYYVYILFLLVLNSLNRPRRRDLEIIKNLYRDGVWTLVVCVHGVNESGLLIQILIQVFTGL
ncbi:hypothetical protein DAEQUDRAFT_672872 [Daedalea quercina L-15889]|uniref:DUF6533 domain-containing protein n=1 Tax=Daedalea quercina L-15889 TaxID=1314783 RepID=A0A165P013_9APHY|nr:hypothetical protein DAEQUDRAFT_672872 [Daedalea quercina L-15889]